MLKTDFNRLNCFEPAVFAMAVKQIPYNKLKLELTD